MVEWSRAVTTEFAFEPLGSSVAAAIVVTCLFFCCFCMAIFNLCKTRFPYYDVRVVAYALRSAYLVHYRPALQGAFVALVNSAFGAQTAVHSIAVVHWLSAHGLTYFHIEERYLLKWISLFLCAAVLVLGWGTGITGCAMEYGAYTRYVVTYGQRLRMAASYGLASVCFVGILVTLRICWAVYFTQDHKSGKSGKAPGKPVHQPRLVARELVCVWVPQYLSTAPDGVWATILILLISYALLSIRAATGCVALYSEQEKYAKWWSNDKFFYTFNTLPELIVMIIDVWPTLYARMCQRYPPGLPVPGSFRYLHPHPQIPDAEQGLGKPSKQAEQDLRSDCRLPARVDTRSFVGPRGVANGHDESGDDDSARQGLKARTWLDKENTRGSDGSGGSPHLLSSQNIMLADVEPSDARHQNGSLH